MKTKGEHKKKKKTCYNCKGTKKEIYHSNPEDKWKPGYWPEFKYQDCSVCNGTGEIEVKE